VRHLPALAVENLSAYHQAPVILLTESTWEVTTIEASLMLDAAKIRLVRAAQYKEFEEDLTKKPSSISFHEWRRRKGKKLR
jgi:hypothetical protein